MDSNSIKVVIDRQISLSAALQQVANSVAGNDPKMVALFLVKPALKKANQLWDALYEAESDWPLLYPGQEIEVAEGLHRTGVIAIASLIELLEILDEHPELLTNINIPATLNWHSTVVAEEAGTFCRKLKNA